MSRGIPGKIIKVLNGIHKDKTGFAYNRDQLPQIIKAGKVAAYVPQDLQGALFPDMKTQEWKRVLFDAKDLQLIGFID